MKKKILMIDDEMYIRKVMTQIFKANNYEIITSDNGIDGINIAAHYLPDLILLDLKMPEIDGIGVCKKLKENPKTKDIPILIITGYPSEDVVEPLTNLGVEHHLVKPFDSDQLFYKIDQIFNENKRGK